MNDIVWQKPKEIINLQPNEIHIWLAGLTDWADFPQDVLNADELQRGRRFVREEDRRSFCLARAFLRMILAHYLPIQPRRLVFREGSHGKLYLQPNPTQLQFNLSHSKDLALYAVTLNQEIGIDIEWIKPAFAIQPLAQRFFTQEESQTLLTLPKTRQAPAFFQLWTRKEAYLKALGLGLSGLSHALTDAPRSITNLAIAPEYASAVALVPPSRLDIATFYHFSINSKA